MKLARCLMSLATAAAMLVSGCGESTAPTTQRPASDLHFLRPSALAPALADTAVSFWARNDADREVKLRYAPLPGSTEGETFLDFLVPAGALATRPDGTAIGPADSVLITVRVSDFSRLIVDFEPSGLKFSPEKTALLKLEFKYADHDFNGDGVEDSSDLQVESQLSLWRQEVAGQPWFKVGSILHLESDEAEASILGFSGYALAY